MSKILGLLLFIFSFLPSTRLYAQNVPQSFWEQRFQQDFLTLKKDFTDHVSIQYHSIVRSDQSQELQWDVASKYRIAPKWRLSLQSSWWRFSQSNTFPVGRNGSRHFLRVGALYEDDRSSQTWDVFMLNQGTVQGLESGYGNFWRGLQWEVRGFYKHPWQDVLSTRVLEGYWNRVALTGNYTLAPNWGIASTLESTEYWLNDRSIEGSSGFATKEQQWSVSLNHSWQWGVLPMIVSYSWERSVVQQAQLPIVLLDQLNHLLSWGMEYLVFSGWQHQVQLSYQLRTLQEEEAWLWFYRMLYDWSESQRVWFNISDTSGSQTTNFLQERRFSLGYQWNF